MRHVLLIVVLVLTGCTSGGPDTVELPPPREFPTREQALDLIYSTTYRVPSDFYVDDRADTPRSYTVYHVKNLAIREEDRWELCTDDFQTAYDWEQADNDRRLIGGVFVEWVENDRYWEFVRELDVSGSVGNTGLTEPGFARVFKCSYVNRDGVDRTNENGYGGTFNAPLSLAAASEFAEYMWQWKYWGATTAKVLDTYSEDAGDVYKHRLLLGLAVDQYDPERDCDLIQIVDWVWIFDKATGEITKRVEAVDRFDAKLENGTPIVCANT